MVRTVSTRTFVMQVIRKRVGSGASFPALFICVIAVICLNLFYLNL